MMKFTRLLFPEKSSETLPPSIIQLARHRIRNYYRQYRMGCNLVSISRVDPLVERQWYRIMVVVQTKYANTRTSDVSWVQFDLQNNWSLQLVSSHNSSKYQITMFYDIEYRIPQQLSKGSKVATPTPPEAVPSTILRTICMENATKKRFDLID